MGSPAPDTSPVPTSPPIPWRTILAAIGAVLATVATVLILRELRRILVWIVIAAFFAVVLGPAVDFFQRRARMRRGLATMLVFLVGMGLLSGLLYLFIRPLVDQSQEFVDNFPRYVEDAKAGRGPLGGIVKRYELDRRIEENQDEIEREIDRLGRNSLDILREIGNAVVAGLTIIVLIILMLLSGPRMMESGLNMLSPPRRERVRAVGADCSRAVTGYVAGNLFISVIAGVAAWVFLVATKVPFRTVLALWVAFADLIPLVGATLGAIPAVIVAFLDSTAKGIATVIFFILYQQFENHVLQVTIMARTVKINPLVVLVSVLAGVELFGILGAFLAIPAAGVIQVIARDIYDERRGRLKPEPTVGAEEIPVSRVDDSGGADAEAEAEAV